jgi:hypothetical protein
MIQLNKSVNKSPQDMATLVSFGQQEPRLAIVLRRVATPINGHFNILGKIDEHCHKLEMDMFAEKWETWENWAERPGPGCLGWHP